MSTAADTPASASMSPYERLLGAAFDQLHPHVQKAHLPPLEATGVFEVRHGSGIIVRTMVSLLGLPPAGPAQPVDLTVALKRGGLIWRRKIGPRDLRTTQIARGDLLIERKGAGTVRFALDVESGSLIYRQVGATLLGLPAPFAPKVQGRVSAAEVGWHVDVVVSWRGKLVCQYGGELRLK
jgi:hypothetical protein